MARRESKLESIRMELFDVQSAILEAEYGTEEREQLREIEKEIEHEMAVIFFSSSALLPFFYY